MATPLEDAGNLGHVNPAFGTETHLDHTEGYLVED
jgi:hypothetical protein